MSDRLRVALLAGLLVLQAITVMGVVLVTGASTRELLVSEMDKTLSLAVNTVSRRSEDHLQQAERAAVLTDELLESTVVPDADTSLESYLLASLSSESDLTGAYIGRPDGSFVFVSRDGAEANGGTRTKFIAVGDDSSRSVTVVQRDADGVEVDRAVDPLDGYDPRARPWYERAAAAEGPSWTDPYIFFTSQEPGVTSSSAVRDDAGTVTGVVGVDLSLRDVSSFIATLKVSPASEAVLVGTDGNLVAFSDPTQVIVPDEATGGSRRASVDEVSDPALQALFAAALASGNLPTEGNVLVVPFEVDGQRWRGAVTPLPGQPDLLASVAAPEDDFVGSIVATQRRNALMAVAIGLAVVVLALPLINTLIRRVQRVQDRADTDPLTGLANRRRFDEALAEHLATAESTASPLSMAMIDVDKFKLINDNFGHGVGDEALQTVAGRVRGAVRDNDIVARIGGDEFAVILVDTGEALAAEVMERARRSLSDAPTNTTGGEIRVRITVGVAELSGPDDDAAKLRARADTALYVAKEAGRNLVATPTAVITPVDSPSA